MGKNFQPVLELQGYKDLRVWWLLRNIGDGDDGDGSAVGGGGDDAGTLVML